MDHYDKPASADALRSQRRRFRAVPIRLILPNLVTLLALGLGLTAIRFAIEGRFESAVYAILAAAILDGVDGRIARALKATSRFGAELDSLADFVDFGVAPAITLYLWSLHEIKSPGWFAVLVFAMAAALRLARFNVMTEEPGRPSWAGNFFVGMPAPAGAGMALMPIYLHYSVFGLSNNVGQAKYHAAYLIFVAFLMVSRIPHFSGKRVSRIPREYFVFVLFFITTFGILLTLYTMDMLVVICSVYFIMIPLAMRQYRRLDAAERAQNEAQTTAGDSGGV